MDKLIIAGSRNFNDYNLLNERVAAFTIDAININTIISGTARGADQLGERYAEEHSLGIIRMPAEWDKYGKSAGYKRNEQMAIIATHLIAFWDEESRGTAHMINLAKQHQLTIGVVRYLAPELPTLIYHAPAYQTSFTD